MQLLEIGMNTVIIDFTDSPKLDDFTPRFIDAGRQTYRRGDRKLVTNDSKTYKAELTFAFQRLTQAEVDTLEAIYRSREPFLCIPDPIDEPEKVYIVQVGITFRPPRHRQVTDWSQDKSLSALFRQI